MSNTSVDKDQLLWDLNNEKAVLFIPAILYIGILMIGGILGNVLVLYFYGYKSKPTPSTTFILTLAVFDLITCLVGMPMEIADLRYYFNFKSEPACKILRFVTHFSSISSSLALTVIAVDRYRRICKPFERQLNSSHAKVLCVVVAGLSALLSWPAIVFNKVVNINVPNSHNVDLEGHDCTTTKEHDWELYVIITNGIYLFTFIVIAVTLGVLYMFIGRQLFKHKKFRFYVANKRAKSKKIQVRSASSDENLLGPRETSSVFADPPDASGSVVDLREFVTQGMPAVEHDRPTSGFTAVTRTTGVTGLTDISGKSKRSMHSLKSVTICDPSQNQVYPIEARPEHASILGNSGANTDADSTSTRDIARPGSASSFATFSSRPSSAGLSSTFSDMSRRRVPNKLLHDDDEDSDDDVEYEKPDDADDEDLEDEAVDKRLVGDEEDVAENKTFDHVGREVDEAEHLEIPDETKPSELEERINVENTHEIQEHVDALVENSPSEETTNEERPTSSGSSSTKISKVSSKSSRSRRSNVVTPVSNVTITSSIASRASSVKRLKRLFAGAFKTGKMDPDTDNVKELRLKMLDINTVKYTMIMLIITILFVVSFLPYLSLVIWRYYKDQHEMYILNSAELVMFQIGIRSFFLNSSLNPIIYGGFNSKFRAFFYTTCCSFCMKRKRKKKSKKSRDQSDSTSGT